MSDKDIRWSGFQWHTDCALVHRVSDPLPTFQGHDILSIKYHENITKLSYTCNGRWITSHIYDPSNGAIFNYHEWPRTSNPGSLKNYAVELVGPQNGWALIHKAALHVGTLYLASSYIFATGTVYHWFWYAFVNILLLVRLWIMDLFNFWLLKSRVEYLRNDTR